MCSLTSAIQRVGEVRSLWNSQAERQKGQYLNKKGKGREAGGWTVKHSALFTTYMLEKEGRVDSVHSPLSVEGQLLNLQLPLHYILLSSTPRLFTKATSKPVFWRLEQNKPSNSPEFFTPCIPLSYKPPHGCYSSQLTCKKELHRWRRPKTDKTITQIFVFLDNYFYPRLSN